jgi:2-methylcitrate dehydratase PrpD
MSTERTLLEALAALVARSHLSDIGPEGLRQAKLCIIDTIGCMVSGVHLPGVEAMIEAERAENPREEASVIGHRTRLSAEGAARVNGYMGDILELNDNTGGHASIAVVSAVAALAEQRGSSGAQALRAIALGIEVVCRVHAGYYGQIKPFTEAGLSPTAIPNAVGCAAAAAVLNGLGEDAISRSLAIGASLSSWCPAEAFFGDGGSIKPILFGGWPAANGIRSARFAALGLSGPRSVLESPIGYYATVARGFDGNRLTVSDTWLLEQPRRKRHACCGYMHSALDALSAIRNERPDAFAGAPPPRIEIRIPPQYVDAVAKRGAPPGSDSQARFNFEYCAALVACGAAMILPEHSLEYARHLRRPELLAQLARIQIVGDPGVEHYEYSRLRIVVASGGSSITHDAGPALGAPANPMSEAHVMAKVDALVRPHYPAFDLEAWAGAVMNLEQAPDVAWLVGRFADRPESAAAGRGD